MLKFHSSTTNKLDNFKNVAANSIKYGQCKPTNTFKNSNNSINLQRPTKWKHSSSLSSSKSQIIATNVNENDKQQTNNNEILRLKTSAKTNSKSSSLNCQIRNNLRTPNGNNLCQTRNRGSSLINQQQHLVKMSSTSTTSLVSMPTSTSNKQLASRVNSITGKLLESHGAELRRTLFSLKQVFQDDAELANGFLEAKGFECLLKVAKDADQIQQNYILRAIGQLIDQPNGMNCLARHNETLQWLYKLLSSQNRLVVKTSLKLLLQFVGHQNNCSKNVSQFCDAIKQVDNAKGSHYWSHLVALFKESNNNSQQHQLQNQNQRQHYQDANLLIDSMTLVNKTLDQIPHNDEETYFDFIDALENLGMESIIKQYSNFNTQLREQFKLYEQKLITDDEEEDEEARRVTVERTDEYNLDEAKQSSSNQINEQNKISLRREQTRVTFSSNIEKKDTDPNDDDEEEEESDEDSEDGGEDELRDGDVKQASNSRKFRLSQVITRGKSSENHKLPQLVTVSDDTDAEQHTGDDDNNYESANDESNELLPSIINIDTNCHIASKEGSPNSRHHRVDITSRLVQTVNDDHKQNDEPGNCNRHRHQLQLKSQTAPQYQRKTNHNKNSDNGDSIKQPNLENLARGKQLRASISSCSSSDSYVSYGSGYASGSGNSTDHDHKHKSLATSTSAKQALSIDMKKSDPVDDDNLAVMTTSIINLNLRHDKRCGDNIQIYDRDEDDALDNGHNRSERVECDVDKDNERGDEDEEESESKLKQHLSELEQLTDELAKRDIYTTLSKPVLQSADDKHYSSTSRSTGSSKTSSVLSTSSNISSLSLGSNSAPGCSKQQYQFEQTSEPNINKSPTSGTVSFIKEDTTTSDSRSTSATPTLLQASPVHVTQSNSYTNRQQESSIKANTVTKTSQAQDGTGDTSSSVSANHQYAITPKKIAGNNSISLSPRGQSRAPVTPTKQQPQESYYHNLLQWEQLVSKGVTRPLLINDLDFTDLRDEDDCDLLNSNNSPKQANRNHASGEPLSISIPSQQQVQSAVDHDSVDSGASTGSPRSINDQPGIPASEPPPLPPPPISPWFNTISVSRPQSQFMSSPSPPPFDFNSASQQSPREFNRDESPAVSTYSNYNRNSVCVSQAAPSGHHFSTLQPAGLRSASSMSSLLFGNNGKYANKRKKTMKLFWKEVREDRSLLARLTRKKTIWDEIKPVQVDTSKLEELFESKAKDLSLSKSRNGLDGNNQRKVKITVLDAKRSNAINIGMTKLPPMRTIKSAILKMDSSIMNREGIEKILTTMMPTEEEKSRIIEAQLANPDTPLGTAEQFLLNLASISALEARLKLWAFQLDYTQIEKEVAEPLMDLKQAIDEIERSETFRNILGTLLTIGNFLNSTSAKGFQIDYLEKVPEVKDTVHKHSLLHHLCLFIQEKFDPELSSDLYSEFSAVNRASKVDYSEVAKSLKKMQQDCKASWDHLKIVAKHDGLANLMNTCGVSSPSSNESSPNNQHQPKSAGKLNNLSKLSMITTVIGTDSSVDSQQAPTTKQLKMKVSDFLTDCAERIMVLIVIHRRVMNRFQKLLVYLGYPLHQIKQTQPQQILKIINEFALEYRTKRERVKELMMRKQQCQHHHNNTNRWQMNRMRWAGSSQCIDSLGYNGRPNSTASSYASSSHTSNCPDCALDSSRRNLANGIGNRSGSPSNLSQISNYSDYLIDQSYCPRMDSITPVPSNNNCTASRRSHSMSVSMMDLQQQQQSSIRSPNNSFNTSSENYSSSHNSSMDENDLVRQKDEQLRRLLGAGKSLDEACHDLYQMSHWSSTMARTNRQQPHKQRLANQAFVRFAGLSENSLK